MPGFLPLLAAGLAGKGISNFIETQRTNEQQQQQQAAIQQFLNNVNPENQALVGSALNALLQTGGNPQSLINDLVARRTAPVEPPDPVRGQLTTVIDPNDPNALLRQLIDPTSGNVISTLGNAPPPQALVNINTGQQRDLPAGEAIKLGEARQSVQTAEQLAREYQSDFSGLGIGGVGAGLELEAQRRFGGKDSAPLVKYWNNVDADKAKFVKVLFGGNASDIDRQTVDRIYPNPAFSDEINRALLANLKANKEALLRERQTSLQQAGFGGTGSQTSSQQIDIDLTK